MLTELRIANLGVIDDAQLTLGPGFTVVSGETGTGKTMVVTGIDLIVGRRANAGQIRSGADRLVVAARIADPRPDSVAKLDEAGGELDDGELLVVRQLNSSGRSRFHVGGSPVPAGVAAEIVAAEVVIYGQSEQARLARPARQREILDAYGGPALRRVLDRYRTHYDRHRLLRAELDELTATARAREQERGLVEFGLAEIARVDPTATEDDNLAAEQRRLQSVDDLRAGAHIALCALAGTDDDLDRPNTTSLLAEARRGLVSLDDPPAQALAERLAELGYLAADLAGDVSSYLADLATDPARLEWIGNRRAVLATLTRKYGDTLAEVVDWAADARNRLADLTSSSSRVGEVGMELVAEQAALAAAATELSTLRSRAADKLSSAVTTELAALAMPTAKLTFDVTLLDEPGPWGADRINIMFSANPGQQPGPLSAIASGGELSRVRLALEVCLASDQAPTMVFDEVDAGVGGQVATEIGRRLARLAASGQVIVVTHLAQVAAFADRHYVVHKSNDDAVTTSDIAEVSGHDRIAELARMLSGHDSDAAMRHAEELLAGARGEVVGGEH